MPKNTKNICLVLFIMLIFMVVYMRQTTMISPISLTSCKLGVRPALCGTVQVYENRSAKKGRKIDIKVVVIKATSSTPASDPIFFLAGGPGGSAIEAGQKQQFPLSLSDTRDLVFVDQRGTGGSNPGTISQGYPDFSGSTPEQINANTKAKAWEYTILRIVKMDPRFYTTSAAMDDLDEVRDALGYDKINLVGGSYGATAAQYYLRQHETHVRTVTLVDGSLLDIPVFELWGQNSQRALDLIFDRCMADSACQTAFPNVRTEFTELLNRLAVNPVTESFTNPVNLQTASVTFTPDFFAAIISHMIEDAKNDYALPNLLHQAYEENDWKGFTQLYAEGIGPEWWGNLVMEHVIRCTEKWATFDPSIVTKLSKGSYLAGWNISLANLQVFSCKYTPQGMTPEGTTPQSGSKVPVLILNGDVDPIDPPENMKGAKELWPNSLSLVGPYQGHDISNMAEINCWWSIQADFINNASVNGLDTSCMQAIHSPAFDTH